jgi:glycosyltransferase involved in cell wall biosynthesis
MEAMACELPVVSTRLVGIPDLVVHERTGLLASPNDATELAELLQRLLDDSEFAKRLARAGRQHVIEKFELRDCLDSLLGAFETYLEAS